MAGHNATIGGGGFHHVAIKVSDFDRTLRLYCAGLGFKEKVRWGAAGADGDKRGAMLDTGDGNYLEVFGGGKAWEPVGEMASAGVMIHFAMRTSSTDAATALAQAAGFKVTVPPKDVTIQGTPMAVPIRISFVQGPDGEIFEFFQNAVT